MSKQYKNTVYTKRLSREECKRCLDEIIDILKINQVPEIEMLFGFAWGNDYKDWTPLRQEPFRHHGGVGYTPGMGMAAMGGLPVSFVGRRH